MVKAGQQINLALTKLPGLGFQFQAIGFSAMDENEIRHASDNALPL